MSDDEQGEVFAETFYGLHDGLFGFVIQRAGGFVKDDHISLLVKRSGDAYALALTAREAYTTFTDKGFVLLGQAFNAVSDLRLLGGFSDDVGIDLVFGNTKSNVFFDCTIGEKDSLWDMGNMGLPGTAIAGCNGLAINLQLAIRDLK